MRLSWDGQSFPSKKNKDPHIIPPINPGAIANCQLDTVVIQAIMGINISCPAAKAEVIMPTTKPRLAVNHLVATVADRPNPIIPDAIPKHKPMLTNRCHFSKAKTVQSKPMISSKITISTTFITPIRSINGAPIGQSMAVMKYIRPVAIDTSEISQPCASVIGKIKICGALVIVEVANVNKKTIEAITHA